MKGDYISFTKLLKMLAEDYPNGLPLHDTSSKQLRRLQGQQDVIEYIKQLAENEDDE